MKTIKTALVLGATGGVGGEVARKLVRYGWRVLALNRNPGAAPAIEGIEWVAGDAMVRADVVGAAQGAALIVHAVNPPGYKDWDKLVLPMIENTIAAASASGARILLPGTLYNYGSGTAGPIRESTPQRPSSRKGAIRVALEQRLKEAAAHGVKVLIVRAGDFFGPRAGNNWFSQGLVTPGTPVKRIIHPGVDAVGHAWAYLPDLADTMVRLVACEERLDAFACFHFRGHWDGDGRRMIEAIRRVADQPKMKVWRLPWPVLRLLSPFVALFREMAEVRYGWQQEFALDNAKLVDFLGSETHTPLHDAVRDALEGLGCVGSVSAAQPTIAST